MTDEKLKELRGKLKELIKLQAEHKQAWRDLYSNHKLTLDAWAYHAERLDEILEKVFEEIFGEPEEEPNV